MQFVYSITFRERNFCIDQFLSSANGYYALLLIFYLFKYGQHICRIVGTSPEVAGKNVR
jgi:hypothetical protein